MGSGFLAGNDKKLIAKFLKISEEQLEKSHLEKVDMNGVEAWRPKFKKPFGPCTFYKEEVHCIIHPVKPELCRLANCKHDATQEFYKKYYQKEQKELWKIAEEIGGKKKKKVKEEQSE